MTDIQVTHHRGFTHNVRTHMVRKRIIKCDSLAL